MRSSNPEIDAFISNYPLEVQVLLQQIRVAIHQVAPNAIECINYGIPTLKLNGNLVHFSAFKKHIGFYPGASGIAHFKDELSNYKNAKGSVQFPLSEPLPIDLIKRIVQFRVDENLSKTKKK